MAELIHPGNGHPDWRAADEETAERKLAAWRNFAAGRTPERAWYVSEGFAVVDLDTAFLAEMKPMIWVDSHRPLTDKINVRTDPTTLFRDTRSLVVLKPDRFVAHFTVAGRTFVLYRVAYGGKSLDFAADWGGVRDAAAAASSARHTVVLNFSPDSAAALPEPSSLRSRGRPSEPSPTPVANPQQTLDPPLSSATYVSDEALRTPVAVVSPPPRPPERPPAQSLPQGAARTSAPGWSAFGGVPKPSPTPIAAPPSVRAPDPAPRPSNPLPDDDPFQQEQPEENDRFGQWLMRVSILAAVAIGGLVAFWKYFSP